MSENGLHDLNLTIQPRSIDALRFPGNAPRPGDLPSLHFSATNIELDVLIPLDMLDELREAVAFIAVRHGDGTATANRGGAEGAEDGTATETATAKAAGLKTRPPDDN